MSATSTTPTDAQAREAIRTRLDTTFVVEAAAGTGKTTELVRRIVALVARGERLSRMAAVTFTDKAAGEMKLRLRRALEEARQAALEARVAGDARTAAQVPHLEQALAELEVARIGTIHSFCADLLRERPIEANVDPAFEMASEDQVAALLERAFDDWLARTLVAPPAALTRLLRRGGFDADQGASGLLRAAAMSLVDDRDFDAPWPPPPAFSREDAIDALVDALVDVDERANAGNPKSKLVAALHALAAPAVDAVAREERVGLGRDYDGLEAQLCGLLTEWRAWNHQGYPRDFAAGERDALLQRRDELREELGAFAAQVEAELASSLRELLREVVRDYEALKQRAGWLDFTDLMLRTRELLVRDAQVRTAWQRSFTHLFVDEFQDTDPLQADILLLLASDPDAPLVDVREAREAWRLARVVPGKLFVVGDPKQSIYRFRRADVRIYEGVKRHLSRDGAEVLYLQTSFRSLPGIQAVVNAAFEAAMVPMDDGSQAQYVPLAPHRTARPSQPAVIALPAPRVRLWREGPVKGSVEESLPDAVGAFVSWLVQRSGFTVTEGGAEVPVAPRHVCLLFKSLHSTYKEDPVRAYVDALERRQVPHVLMGGRTFHDREEVVALRQVLSAIEWPDDELSVYAALHGPFFALADDALLAFKDTLGHLSPTRPVAPEALLGDDALEAVHAAMDVLRRLSLRRNRLPIAETVTQLLAETRAHASLAFWPSGEQALANVLRVVDHGRRFDVRGTTSFRAFVTWLESAADTERGGGNASIVEEGAEGVRVMTVHKAKGLEFPVVILCSPTENAAWSRPSRYVDPEQGLAVRSLAGCLPITLREHAEEVLEADRAEALRLLYVASTRAQDLLVVPTTGLGEHPQWWLTPLANALHPEPAAKRSSGPAPGCPDFGESSVLDAEQPEETVRPGLHEGLRGGVSVVWWDPALLPRVDDPGGSRHASLLVQDERGQAAEGEAEYRAFRAEHEELRERASTRAHRAQPVTFTSKDPETARWVRGGQHVELAHTTASRAERPRGPRFGTLVHALLAELPFDADARATDDLAHAHARVLGATPDEQRAAVAAVTAAFAHPLMQRAVAADALRRETPILLRAPDDTLVEGIVDLAFREGDTWTVVDFKTDLGDTAAPHYLVQVRLYADAITRATGQPSRAVLFGV
ncbi:MAG: UvrD-helicase domain-containing protein [Sandaracinaceae bacterium]|nr:UvrD-helicase domain-containing protein [Sandaracinaceae bacterium]